MRIFLILITLLGIKSLNFLENKDACEQCEQFFQNQYNGTAYNFVFDEVKQKIIQICDIVSVPEQCPGYVNLFMPTIFNSLVVKYMGPKKICNFLKFCNYQYEELNIDDFYKQVFENKTEKKNQFKILKQNGYNILHLTDLHIDQLYKEGTNSNCAVESCCSVDDAQSEQEKALYWGTVAKCDLPPYTVEETIKFIAQNLEFDYVIWTGDSASHKEWMQNKETQLDNQIMITNFIKKYINKPVIPIFGNHESFPCDNFNVFNLTQNNYQLKTSSEIWQQYLDAQAVSDLKNKGFYSMQYDERNIKFIVINSAVFDNLNFYLMRNSTNPDSQLEWIINELQKCEDQQQDCFIIGHISPGDHFGHSTWAKRYQIIIDRYQKSIKGQFFGHSHYDQIQFSRKYKTNDPTNIILIAPSLTTSNYQQPSFRLIKMNANNTIQNYLQYRLNLTEANNDKTKLQYKLAYDFLQEYDIPYFDLDLIFKRLQNLDQFYLEKYARNFYTNSSYFQNIYDNLNIYQQKYFKCFQLDVLDHYIDCMGLEVIKDDELYFPGFMMQFSKKWQIIKQ